MSDVMTVETRYLVTDGWDIFRFADSKKEAAELAEDEVSSYGCDQIEIYELKKIGYAYIPDPNPVVEWDE